MRALPILALVCLPTLALAQEAPAQDPLRSPGFTTIDRFDQNSRVGVEASYNLYDIDANDTDLLGLRFELHGHYVDPASGFGGYGQLPIGFASVDGPGGNDDESATGVGNFELGGLYMKQVANLLGIVGRAGLVLPTSSDDPDDADKIFASTITSGARITDLVNVYPGGTALRFSGSALVRAGKLFARGDLGFDIVLAEPDGVDYDNVIRFNAGLGYDGGGFAVGGELALASANDSATNIALFGRFAAGPASPYLAIIFPLEPDLVPGIELTAAFTFGLDVNLN